MSEDEKDGDANSSDSTPAGETFEVEKILDVIRGRGNQPTRYKIRWAGYTAADDTWEEEKNLDCPDILKKFWDARVKGKRPKSTRLGSGGGCAPRRPRVRCGTSSDEDDEPRPSSSKQVSSSRQSSDKTLSQLDKLAKVLAARESPSKASVSSTSSSKTSMLKGSSTSSSRASSVSTAKESTSKNVVPAKDAPPKAPVAFSPVKKLTEDKLKKPTSTSQPLVASVPLSKTDSDAKDSKKQEATIKFSVAKESIPETPKPSKAEDSTPTISFTLPKELPSTSVNADASFEATPVVENVTSTSVEVATDTGTLNVDAVDAPVNVTESEPAEVDVPIIVPRSEPAEVSSAPSISSTSAALSDLTVEGSGSNEAPENVPEISETSAPDVITNNPEDGSEAVMEIDNMPIPEDITPSNVDTSATSDGIQPPPSRDPSCDTLVDNPVIKGEITSEFSSVVPESSNASLNAGNDDVVFLATLSRKRKPKNFTEQIAKSSKMLEGGSPIRLLNMEAVASDDIDAEAVTGDDMNVEVVAGADIEAVVGDNMEGVVADDASVNVEDQAVAEQEIIPPPVISLPASHPCFGTAPTVSEFVKGVVVHNVNNRTIEQVFSKQFKLRCESCTGHQIVTDDTVDFGFALITYNNINYFIFKLATSGKELFLINAENFRTHCPDKFDEYADIIRTYFDTMSTLEYLIEQQQGVVREATNTRYFQTCRANIDSLNLTTEFPDSAHDACKEIVRLFFLELQLAIGTFMIKEVDSSGLHEFVLNFYEKRRPLYSIINKEAVENKYEALYTALVCEEASAPES